MTKWREIKTGIRGENGQAMINPPKGPYICRPQYKGALPPNVTWDYAMEETEPMELIFSMPEDGLFYGCFIYANVDGVAVRVAHHVDSSD